MSRILPLFLVAGLAGMGACASNSVTDNYYSLVLAADSDSVAESGGNLDSHLIVGPVQLPAYLDGRGIAMQMSASQIRTANHHFWAEPLDDAIAKVLVGDLSNLMPDVGVDRDVGRWTVAGNCRLRIEFDSFHATSESRVVNSGRYWIASEVGSTRQEFDLAQSLSADGYAHAVEALRKSLGKLSALIANQVESQSHCSPE